MGNLFYALCASPAWLGWFTEESYYMPNWAWVLIGFIVLVLIIIIIVCSVVGAKKKKAVAESAANAQPYSQAPEPLEDKQANDVAAETESAPVTDGAAVEVEEDSDGTVMEKEETEEYKEDGESEAPRIVEDKPERQPADEKPAKKTAEKKAAGKSAENGSAKTTATGGETKPNKSAAAKNDAPQAAAGGAAKNAVKVYHISKRKDDGKWQIKAAGGARAIKLFNTQAEAIDYAKTLAGKQDANIVIHKTDGSFRKLKY